MGRGRWWSRWWATREVVGVRTERSMTSISSTDALLCLPPWPWILFHAMEGSWRERIYYAPQSYPEGATGGHDGSATACGFIQNNVRCVPHPICHASVRFLVCLVVANVHLIFVCSIIQLQGFYAYLTNYDISPIYSTSGLMPSRLLKSSAVPN